MHAPLPPPPANPDLAWIGRFADAVAMLTDRAAVNATLAELAAARDAAAAATAEHNRTLATLVDREHAVIARENAVAAREAAADAKQSDLNEQSAALAKREATVKATLAETETAVARAVQAERDAWTAKMAAARAAMS